MQMSSETAHPPLYPCTHSFVPPPRLGEAAAVPGAPGAAPTGLDQEAPEAEDHLLESAAAAPEPAFPAHAVPGAAREGPAGCAARPHPDAGKDLVSEQTLQV